jgi:photosystem II stability/assembly factor-like uncharacterized protein
MKVGSYTTAAIPACDADTQGAIVFDTDRGQLYVCTNAGSPWEPLESDYDQDGIMDSIDTDDNNINDATAVIADGRISKTFYAGGESRTHLFAGK